MVDFARMTRMINKRDKAFQAWREGAFPGADWDALDATTCDYIKTAWDRGFGQGYATGYSEGIGDGK